MNTKLKLLSFLLLLNTVSFSQGVKFDFMTLNESLTKAKNENKIIFLHVGERCGWGNYSYKVLEKSDEAGKFFNYNFINVRPKNDYEVDAVFSITDSPRYLFISPNGEILMMVSMYHKPKELIRLAKKVQKGKVIKPNLFMYTDKMYPRNKKTLKLLTYTLEAYQMFNFNDSTDFSSAEYDLLNEVQIKNPKMCFEKLEASFKYGKYYFNQFLLVLYYEKSGNHEKAKELAKEILIKYPHEDFRKTRQMTDSVLTQIISENYLEPKR